jgi:hypothetical protein
VTFPSGATIDSGDANMNLCMNCHQGRQSGADVRAALADLPLDSASADIRFLNIHYFPAGATVFGNQAGAGFEYAGKTYAGRFAHIESYDSCTECHNAHQLVVEVAQCGVCHEGVATEEDLAGIRVSETDFDGDGDAEEGLAGELDTMREKLYAAIQAYAADRLDAPIVYDSHSYPYFFADTDGDGEPDADEANYGNRYQSWSPRLLEAAYNYQYASKDPGAFAHNGTYVLQLLYDSIQDLGGDLAGAVRP